MATKYSFGCDYSSGAHPSIYEALMKVNDEPQHGVYGQDEHCFHAADIIREMIGQPDAQVEFISGGTQTNLIALSYCLQSWEAVVAVTTGHVAVHETGAIEMTGHKVIAVPSEDGKMHPNLLDDVLDEHSRYGVHMVVPKLVFISQSTEMGGLYTKAEVQELRAYCDEKGLYLHLDGARIGSALAAESNDLTLKDIGALTDTFYIGGTKSGAMFGEALVLINPSFISNPGIRHSMKQRGALLAKGWFLGVQFEKLLENDAELMLSLCRHANRMAAIIKNGFISCGFEPVMDSNTNLQFFILPAAMVERIEEKFLMSRERLFYEEDGRVSRIMVRLVTMWNTKEEQCHRLAALVRELTDEMQGIEA
eukprot:gene10729-7459_t